jgi:hypothetical protein
MHSFATGSCQGAGRNSQPTGLVERNTKIIVLRLPCNLTATIHQPETTRHVMRGNARWRSRGLLQLCACLSSTACTPRPACTPWPMQGLHAIHEAAALSTVAVHCELQLALKAGVHISVAGGSVTYCNLPSRQGCRFPLYLLLTNGAGHCTWQHIGHEQGLGGGCAAGFDRCDGTEPVYCKGSWTNTVVS